jgi:hypothetical protein
LGIPQENLFIYFSCGAARRSSLERRLEAAPRFELGIKVLQTRALPLGYAATNNSIIYLQKVNILNVA